MRLNYRRGLFRLWIIASVVWLAAVAIMHDEEIVYYAGFHYGLLSREPSWRAALKEKQRQATLFSLCQHVDKSASMPAAGATTLDRAEQVIKLSESTKLPPKSSSGTSTTS